MSDPKWLVSFKPKPFPARASACPPPPPPPKRDLRAMSFKDMHKEAIRDFGKTLRAEKFANAMRRIQMCHVARDEYRAATRVKTL